MVKKELYPAVIYPSNSPSGFGVMRSLYPYGIRIFGLDNYKNFVRFSRKFEGSICPDPALDSEGFIDFLIEQGKVIGKAVLFTSSDLALFLICKNRARLEQYYFFPYLDDALLEIGLDKWKMTQAAQKAGIPVPKTIFPRTMKDIGQELPSFPLIIKPAIPQFVIEGGRAAKINEFLKTSHYAKVLKVKCTEDLRRISKDLFVKDIQFIVQEEIPGGCGNLFESKCYANKRGVIVELFTGKKIRQMPPDFGICSLGESVQSAEVEAYTLSFIEKTGFHGMGEMEFKYDVRDKEFKFIEINARSNHWIYAATFAGQNIPLAQYEDLTGMSVTGRRPEKKDVNLIDLKNDLSFFAKYCLKRSSPYHTNAGEWVRTIFAKPVVDTFLSWDDPFLGIIYIIKCSALFCAKLTKNIILNLTGINISKR